MLQFGHNGFFSMDATFGTNNVKYHLFTLMAFDSHQIGVLITWVITNQQTCEYLVEWLSALQQSFSCICQIGDHHVSLWMMPHKNSEHCGRLYINFLCFVALSFVLVLH
jgi:hypothetical protein